MITLCVTKPWNVKVKVDPNLIPSYTNNHHQCKSHQLGWERMHVRCSRLKILAHMGVAKQGPTQQH